MLPRRPTLAKLRRPLQSALAHLVLPDGPRFPDGRREQSSRKAKSRLLFPLSHPFGGRDFAGLDGGRNAVDTLDPSVGAAPDRNGSHSPEEPSDGIPRSVPAGIPLQCVRRRRQLDEFHAGLLRGEGDRLAEVQCFVPVRMEHEDGDR